MSAPRTRPRETQLTRLRDAGNAAMATLVGGRPVPSVQRQLLPAVDDMRAELRYNGPDSVRETLGTLFHRLHASKRLFRPDRLPFESATAALDVVLVPGRVRGGPPELIESMYRSIVDQASQQAGAAQAAAITVKGEHWALLAPVVGQAAKVAHECAGRPDLIEAVFGPTADLPGRAQAFGAVAARLGGFGQANFVVKYGGSEDATRAAGASRAGSGLIQLSPSEIASVTVDPRRAISTLIHEAAHETNASIVDLGYSGSPGFEHMVVKDKLGNADHYAEVAERILGISPYGAVVFLPKSGVLAGTAVFDLLRKRAKSANDGLEQLWAMSLGVVDTYFPKLLPDPSDTERQATDKRRLVAQIKAGFHLPAAGRPYVVTKVDIALVETTTMVLARAKSALTREAKMTDPLRAERLLRFEQPFDLASAALRRVGGLTAGGAEASDRQHYDLVVLFTELMSGKTPYPD